MKKILLIILLSQSIQANSIEECGRYELFGKVVEKSGLYLKINSKTKSEYNLKIDAEDYPKIATYLNQFIRANWNINQISYYRGEISNPRDVKIEIENHLNPIKNNFMLLEKQACLKK